MDYWYLLFPLAKSRVPGKCLVHKLLYLFMYHLCFEFLGVTKGEEFRQRQLNENENPAFIYGYGEKDIQRKAV